jgi:hypothetical protein
MAKRRRSTAIEEAAEDLGRLLGSAQRKAEAWLGQRKAVSRDLARIRDAASDLLGQLGGRGASLVNAVRRGRSGRRAAASGSAAAPRRRRTMSKAARAKISAAQRKRWAALKKAK